MMKRYTNNNVRAIVCLNSHVRRIFMVTDIKNSPTKIEDALQRIQQLLLKETVGKASTMLVAAGIFEMLSGVGAVAISSLAGAVFVVLTGAALMASGAFEFISAFARNNLTRFIWGIISMAAGLLVAAQPSIGLNILAAIVSIYLLATGIARMFGTEKKFWTRVGGAIGIILGTIILLRLSTVSAPLIGWLVGINIFINGMITVAAGNELKNAIR